MEDGSTPHTILEAQGSVQQKCKPVCYCVTQPVCYLEIVYSNMPPRDEWEQIRYLMTK